IVVVVVVVVVVGGGGGGSCGGGTEAAEIIQNLFLHFWQGYPTHLEGVLKLDITADVIAVCDSILYKVLLDVLLPHSIQDLPEGLCTDVRSFLKALPGWMDNSLEDLVPDAIKKVKRSGIVYTTGNISCNQTK
ncbi:DNA-binding protein RFX6-like, partial [Elysia marginata]